MGINLGSLANTRGMLQWSFCRENKKQRAIFPSLVARALLQQKKISLNPSGRILSCAAGCVVCAIPWNNWTIFQPDIYETIPFTCEIPPRLELNSQEQLCLLTKELVFANIQHV